jgi:DNA-binding transcriptional regulator YdaS (Cro superfamily)
MTLKDFFDQYKAPTQMSIAAKIGMDASYLGRIVQGARMPGPRIALAIYKAVDKKVSIASMNPELGEFIKAYNKLEKKS